MIKCQLPKHPKNIGRWLCWDERVIQEFCFVCIFWIATIRVPISGISHMVWSWFASVAAVVIIRQVKTIGKAIIHFSIPFIDNGEGGIDNS